MFTFLAIWAAVSVVEGGVNGDLLPWIGAGTAWMLVGTGVVMVFRGNLGTTRQMNAHEAEIAFLREANQKLSQTNESFLAAIDTSTAMIRAVVEMAQRKPS